MRAIAAFIVGATVGYLGCLLFDVEILEAQRAALASQRVTIAELSERLARAEGRAEQR